MKLIAMLLIWAGQTLMPLPPCEHVWVAEKLIPVFSTRVKAGHYAAHVVSECCIYCGRKRWFGREQ